MLQIQNMVSSHRQRVRETHRNTERDRDSDSERHREKTEKDRGKDTERDLEYSGNSVYILFFSFRELQFKDFIYLFPLIWTYGEEGKEED